MSPDWETVNEAAACATFSFLPGAASSHDRDYPPPSVGSACLVLPSRIVSLYLPLWIRFSRPLVMSATHLWNSFHFAYISQVMRCSGLNTLLTKEGQKEHSASSDYNKIP